MPRAQATNRIKIANMPNALTFNGAQRISLTTMGDLGSSMGGGFSYGVWIQNTSKITTIQYYLGTSNSAGGNYLLCGISRNTSNLGNPNFQIRDNTGNTLGVEIERDIRDGQWHFLVCTKDATSHVAGMHMYLDGVDMPLTTIADVGLVDPQNFNRNLAIGSGLGTGAVTLGWVGQLSRPYFFDRELTPTEVSDWYYQRKVPTSPFAGYENTEGAGTTVTDVNNVYNGTLTSATQWSTDTPYKSRPARTY